MAAAIPVLTGKMYGQCDRKGCQNRPGFPIIAPQLDMRTGVKLSNIHFLSQAGMQPLRNARPILDA